MKLYSPDITKPTEVNYYWHEKVLVEPMPKPKQGEWIPCSERLPDESGWYLITDWCGGVDTEWYADEEDYIDRNSEWCCEGAVIAWMPLPEPWEGADDE